MIEGPIAAIEANAINKPVFQQETQDLGVPLFGSEVNWHFFVDSHRVDVSTGKGEHVKHPNVHTHHACFCCYPNDSSVSTKS